MTDKERAKTFFKRGGEGEDRGREKVKLIFAQTSIILA
jgi:hypothetical protein